MTLTVGAGPFGHLPAGRFNFDAPRNVEYLEPFGRRIRAELGGEVVIDTIEARMLHEHGHLPVWCFPEGDVRRDRLGDGAWVVADGLAAGLVRVSWDAVDRWLEEDEEVIVHPRDPYHRLALRDTSRRVRVLLDGELLAESTRALALFETSLPPRWYLPPEDVRAELRPNDWLRTGCAYKGYASYHDVRPEGGGEEPFLAWHYEDPLDEVKRIQGLVCFFNERVDLEVDGVTQERPRTQWSGTRWAQAPSPP
jgi:uncharacterized protein (DUF427 family)